MFIKILLSLSIAYVATGFAMYGDSPKKIMKYIKQKTNKKLSKEEVTNLIEVMQSCDDPEVVETRKNAWLINGRLCIGKKFS